ncbi:MAG: hypothetical protein LBP98_09990 [Tannerella sp.]|jgi:hypothetical protein|nr:hypothetical protein [Tannerella sp.]
MKKKIFTLCMISFLLSGVFSNVRAQSQYDAYEVVNSSQPTMWIGINVSVNTGKKYVFTSCLPSTLQLSVTLGPRFQAISGWTSPRGDKFRVFVDGDTVAVIEPYNATTAELNVSVATPQTLGVPLPVKSAGEQTRIRFEYLNTGPTPDQEYKFGDVSILYVDYPTVSTILDLKGNLQTIYDAFYDRTTQYPGEVAFTITGGSPDLQYHVNNGIELITEEPKNEGLEWRPVYVDDEHKAGSKTVKLSAVDIQNLIPGSAILVREPNGCKGEKEVIATYAVPEESSTSSGSIKQRAIYLPKVAGAKLIPGEGTHFVPTGKSFSFKVIPTGDNVGLKPEVTTAEEFVDPEGNDLITYKQESEGIWVVTLHGVQKALNVNISFPTEQSSTGNAAVDGNQVWGAEGAAYITSATAGSAGIYSSTGALVKTVTYPAGTTTVPLPAGFYIIAQGGGNNYKVIVK